MWSVLPTRQAMPYAGGVRVNHICKNPAARRAERGAPPLKSPWRLVPKRDGCDSQPVLAECSVMRIGRLVLISSLAALGIAVPALAGQRGGHAGGHPPRPAVQPPLLHGAAPRPAAAKPAHPAGGHRVHHHRGHRSHGSGQWPLLGPIWPGYGWPEPVKASARGNRTAAPAQFGPVLVLPGIVGDAGYGAPRRERPKPGYYDTPRPMAKIIHLRRNP